MIIENENTYLIFTYFRGNLISRKWDGYISRDLVNLKKYVKRN